MRGVVGTAIKSLTMWVLNIPLRVSYKIYVKLHGSDTLFVQIAISSDKACNDCDRLPLETSSNPMLRYQFDERSKVHSDQ